MCVCAGKRQQGRAGAGSTVTHMAWRTLVVGPPLAPKVCLPADRSVDRSPPASVGRAAALYLQRLTLGN